ncbi:MAG: Gfo/Idh/MocA family oxidoreductase, partial [Candidatus Brocadiae bacterium]|nr:Gfo/Idh/MocA family oxidoreductase [Candidatus Brocadiia bacterium]
GAKLAGVCDANAARAAEIAAKHGAPAFGDWRELRGRVDAVVIATPTAFHAEVAEAFLSAGVSCLVEKPMTSTVADGERLVAAARASGARLQVGHIERFNPSWTAALPGMGDVRFIQAERVSPYPFRSTDIDVVLDLMIHDIDLVLALARAPLERVEAWGMKVLSPTNDLVSARLAFGDGMIANLTASRVSPEPARTFRTIAADAFVEIDLRGRKVRRVTRSAKLAGGFDVRTVDPSKINPKEFLYGELLETTSPAVPPGEPLALEQAAFVEAVERKTPTAVTGEDGVNAVRVAARVLEAVGR